MDQQDERMQAEGEMEELKGKVKANWNDLTGDTGDQLKGKAEEWKGKAKQAVGDAMDELEDAGNRSDRA